GKYFVSHYLPSIRIIHEDEDGHGWRMQPVTGFMGIGEPVNGSYRQQEWNDDNLDGLVDSNELHAQDPNDPWLPSRYTISHIDANLDHYFIDVPTSSVWRQPVQWVGSTPVYDVHHIDGVLAAPAVPRFADAPHIGSGPYVYLHHDVATNSIYAA